MDYFEQFQDVLDQEGRAILATKERVRPEDVGKLLAIYRHLRDSGGEMVVCGVGKSGQVANKMVSTFNSIGLRSSFLHPVEALHGDIGRISSQDALVLISKSGSTEEIVKLIPYVPMPPERMIGLLGNPRSKLGQICYLCFDCSVIKEACINNQAPTTSSTVALAVGDAMAVLWESLVGLSREGFAINHPSGFLGKSLRLKVCHLMLPAEKCAVLSPAGTLQEAIIKMTEFPIGLCALCEGEMLKGILTEGDIRRALVKDLGLEVPLAQVASHKPILIGPNDLALEALRLMELRERPLNVLPVVQEGRFLGALRLHELLSEGLFCAEKG